VTAIFTNTFTAALAVDPTLMDYAQVEMVMFSTAASLRPDQEVEGTAPVSDSPYAAIDTIAGLEAQLGWGPSIPQTATLTLPDAADQEGTAPVTYFAEMSNDIPFKLPPSFPTSLVKAIAFVYKGPRGQTVGHYTFPGAIGNYLSVPDEAAFGFLSDICIVARVRTSDWTPSGPAVIVSQWNASVNERGWHLLLGTSGILSFGYSTSGADTISRDSTAAVPAAANGWKWVAVTFDAVDGANNTTRFWTGDDGVAWTPLGTPVSAVGNVTRRNSTAALTINGLNDGTSNLFNGDIS
jgi:hypothetical protein